jgi:sugar-specific transcriptional regulator TrmB
LPRTTLYSVLQTLQSRNLIGRQRKHGVLVFKVAPPTALLDLVYRRGQAVQEERNVAKLLLVQLEQLYKVSLDLEAACGSWEIMWF